jgi:hypothetical protein
MMGLRGLISRGLAGTIALTIGIHFVGCGSASRKDSTPIGSPVAVGPSEPTEPTPRVHGPGEPDSTTAPFHRRPAIPKKSSFGIELSRNADERFLSGSAE